MSGPIDDVPAPADDEALWLQRDREARAYARRCRALEVAVDLAKVVIAAGGENVKLFDVVRSAEDFNAFLSAD